MPRVNIYIKGQAKVVIDNYCKGNNVSFSRFLVNSALRQIRHLQPQATKCQKCGKETSVGKYKLMVYDWDSGEQEQILMLGNNCLRNAQKEGVEVRKID